ncbi:3-oxoacyl-[acyl-carrier-protein] synthase III C-terminal domain-containing protein [Clostridium beijerinckii]|uniref:3-oxoacyl-[acyl-carrier-protein] synthase III C-terminal domain-containing protein n=1 Tax=Clostridium beijerinckii TaxID=1520 RepID=UPI0022E4121B|nr:3-oxoacyl-[acyl-carrier-protein] synthase III C-terminal domain-containing protein [Clostridium beijerinckii]
MNNTKEHFSNVIIKGMGTYLAANKIGNEPYIEQFKEYDVDLEHIFEALGRKYRYVSTDIEETTITMAIKAAEKALDNGKISVDDLDVIVFASNTPEYLSPSNALLIQNKLDAKNVKVVFDINCDCAGMTLAIDTVTRLLKTNKRYKKGLVVGSVMMSAYGRKDDVSTVGFSDNASAVVLELVKEDIERGFIDSVQITDTSFEIDFVRNPQIGFSKYLRTDIADKETLKFSSHPKGGTPYTKIWTDLTLDLCENNGLTIDELDYVLLSPLAKHTCEDFIQSVYPDTYENKFTFQSEELGYLGLNSEIFQLEDAINRGIVSEGSNVLMNGTGVGITTLMALYRL